MGWTILNVFLTSDTWIIQISYGQLQLWYIEEESVTHISKQCSWGHLQNKPQVIS